LRLLELHVDFIEYEPVGKEAKLAEDAEKRLFRFEDALVMLVSVEPEDEDAEAEEAVKDATEHMKSLKINRLVIYPFAHLSNNLARPEHALEILKTLERKARETGVEVHRAPFGWNKALRLSIKGHPLAERSRAFAKEKREKKEQTSPAPRKEYYILDTDGKIYPASTYPLDRAPQEFRILVEREALGMESRREQTAEPEYIRILRRYGIDWEEMSDLGHMRYGPEGAVIYDLVAAYAEQVARETGLPVYSVKGTNMFSLENRAIREHAGLFGQRMYRVEVDGRSYVMRYAACFQQFALAKDWVISYKHLPFGEFEVADSYRLEQSGELVLGFRVRRMNMPDFHIFCRDLEEAKQVFKRIHGKIYEEIEKLGRDYVSLYNLTSKSFFEENRDFFMELVKRERKPVLLSFYPEGSGYYWVLNIEYHIIDRMNRPREIGTVQMDIGNAERFGITYVDKEGQRRYPVILHTAIIGTIERWIYAVLDTALRKNPPELPTWLSPTQVRIIPLSQDFVERAVKLAERLNKLMIRADVDDRDESLDKKVREAEVSWIPYIVTLGRRELEKKTLSVRVRRERRVVEMKPRELIKRLKEETRGYPAKPMPLPTLVSIRPLYSTGK